MKQKIPAKFEKLLELNAAKYASQYKDPRFTNTPAASVALAEAAYDAAWECATLAGEANTLANDGMVMADLRLVQVREAAKRPDALLAACLASDAWAYALQALRGLDTKLARKAERELGARAYAIAYPTK
jgi:hypothetical protein